VLPQGADLGGTGVLKLNSSNNARFFWIHFPPGNKLDYGQDVVADLIGGLSELCRMNPKFATGRTALLVLILSAAALAQRLALPATPPLPVPLNTAGTGPADDVNGPGRDRWQMPNEILAALDLKKGDVVADIGAGVGYFAVRFAQAVGPEGKVYAVDIAAHVLEYLKKEAQKQDLRNIETIVSREDDPLLPRDSLDLAFFCNTVHEIAARVNFYRRVRQALKRTGRMAIIDSLSLVQREGEESHESAGQASRDLTVREAEQAGFRLVKEPKFLPRQYFLVFERVEEAPKSP
jgi:predicted methyltransferase